MEIANLEKQISDIESSNEETTKKVDIIQDEYDQLSKEKDKGSSFLGNKEREQFCYIYRLKGKVFDETKRIEELKEELSRKNKDLRQYKSENAYMIRMNEKNKIFKEGDPDKELVNQEAKNNETINYYAKKVTDLGTELEFKKEQYDDISLIKNIDKENTELVVYVFNKEQKEQGVLFRDLAVAQGKIAELENLHQLNLKYIEEESTQRRRLLKEQDILQKELDNKSKLRDEELKQIIKEKERSKIIELQNKIEIENSELEFFIVNITIN